MHAFVLELNKPLPVTSQRFELIEARWMPWRDLHKDPQVGPDVKDLLATWFKV